MVWIYQKQKILRRGGNKTEELYKKNLHVLYIYFYKDHHCTPLIFAINSREDMEKRNLNHLA